MPLIPEKIHLLPEIATYASLEKPIVQILKEGHWLIAGARLWAKWKCAHYRKYHPAKMMHPFFNMWLILRLVFYHP